MTDTVGEAQQAGVDVLMVETGESYEGRPIYVIEVTYDVIKYLIDIFCISQSYNTCCPKSSDRLICDEIIYFPEILRRYTGVPLC